MPSNPPGRAEVPSVLGPPTPGALLAGRYVLGARVGRGGMADVFASTDQVLARAVAVKVFRFEGDTTQDRARMQTEVRLLASLRHPNLVTVYDASTDSAGHDGHPFIVMELIAGPSLRERLADGPLGPQQAAALGADIATALDHVHGQGIVHRDVKPANILLDPRPADPLQPFTAKLADFGIARLLDATRVTMVGTTIGTANYLSPEQVEGGDIGPASDIYSLGLVLIESLTGQVAYPGIGAEAVLARLHRPPTLPTEHGPGWAQLLEAMTAAAVDLRPSAADVHTALKTLSGGASRAVLAATVPMPASQSAAMPTRVADGGDTMTRVLGATRARTAAAVVRTHPKWVAYAGAALVVVLAALALSLVVADHGATPTPAPAYPSVPGQLGRDLHQLQKAVG